MYESYRQALPDEILFVAGLESTTGRRGQRELDRYMRAKRLLQGESDCQTLDDTACASCALYGLEKSERFCARLKLLAERNGTINPE